MMEILAPAGSFESIICAIRSGADAVYFGTSAFNARRNAQNLSNEELFDAVSYCHIRGVQAYLTLNTLISDIEINDALDVVKAACDAGIDGVIVQDLGLADLIKQAAPKMPLHASTQMSVHTVSGVELLHSKGFKRVVLAREITKTELKEIAKVARNLKVELEIFVHGALCMSVSGQCLLSAVLGSRSGNRGLCAGPCRMPFTVKNGCGYDLSLKDLNLYKYFDDFKEMGITSLKIEGRMKRPEYVAMAVDAAVTALNNKDELPEKLNTLKNVFSRSGFTDGYYKNEISADMFGIRSERDIADTKQVLTSVHELYRRERQAVSVDMKLEVLNGKPIKLVICDGKNTVSVTGEIPQTAINRPVDYECLKEKLGRCGGTPYYLDKFEAQIDDNLSVAASLLSGLKTQAFDKLSELRGKAKAIDFFNYPELKKSNRKKEHRKTYISLHNINQLPDNPDCADMVFLPLSTDTESFKNLIDKGYNVAVKTPPYFFGKDDMLYKRLCELKKAGLEYAVAENLGSILPIQKADLKIIGGAGLNCYNSNSIKTLPFEQAILSYELSEELLSNISADIPCGIVAYGRIPLMLLRNCPSKARIGCAHCDGKITDRMNIDFKLMCEDGATRLYNDRPLYLADRPYILNRMDFIVLSFVDEDKNTVEKTIENYKENFACNQKFTRGLYVKGVK